MTYLNYSRVLKRCFIVSQKNQNMRYIQSAPSKGKAVWNIIKKYSIDTLKPNEIDKIMINNSDVTDPHSIATCFNNFFIDIVHNNTTVDTKHKDLNHVKCNQNSMYITPVSIDELGKIVQSLKNSKSVGSDGIRTDIVKICFHYIAAPLAHAINLSLEQGTFPENLKLSIVKPLFKKGSSNQINNYRPVSLLTIFSKIYEKVMYKRLYSFVESYNIISDEQNGFRKNKSTSLAAFNLVKNVTDALDRKNPVSVIFMDMSKAFDFVCHDRLLQKLQMYGIRGPAYNWIQSYLTGRTQCVEISKYDPDTKTLTPFRSEFLNNKFGVPQGSILGPLLFLLYINDLPNAIHQRCILFADDTTIIVEGVDRPSYEQQINDAVSSAISWLRTNNLKVNIDKTKLISFRTNNNNQVNVKVTHDGHVIDTISHIKFLGIYIDNLCSWKQHVDNVCSRINSFVYPLRRISQVVNKEAAITAYYGYVNSLLRYGIIIWGRCVDIERVFIMQKRCLRAIFGLKLTDSCRPYYREHKILTLTSIYILDVSIFVFQHKSIFQEASTMSKYSVRPKYQNKLFRPITRLTLSSNNSFIMAIKIYNKIPDNLKIMTFYRFKSNLTRWLAEKCFYSINEFFNYKI